jgi:hypothetical protein
MLAFKVKVVFYVNISGNVQIIEVKDGYATLRRYKRLRRKVGFY